MPRTTDQHTKVLKAFRDGDPNGNGAADEIPLIGCTECDAEFACNYIINAFV